MMKTNNETRSIAQRGQDLTPFTRSELPNPIRRPMHRLTHIANESFHTFGCRLGKGSGRKKFISFHCI